VLANNAGVTLELLGRWDEAAAIIAEAIDNRPVRERLYARLTLAEIQVARGRFDEARGLLGEVRDAARAAVDPRFVGPLHVAAAELAIWTGDPDAARVEVAEGLAAVGAAENTLVLLRLCAVGLRAAADLRLRRHPDAGDPDVWAGELTARVRAATADPATTPEAAAMASTGVAEWARADSTDTPAVWEAVADAWTRLERPYRVAYARWREADAALAAGDRTRAEVAARAAYTTARHLAAAPLVSEVAATARRGRLDLDIPVDQVAAPVPASPPNPFRLTRRETQVLTLLCAGRKNREIARTLFISERTAGVHVSNILAKFKVTTRGEAAAIAHRLRLVAESDDRAIDGPHSIDDSDEPGPIRS